MDDNLAKESNETDEKFIFKFAYNTFYWSFLEPIRKKNKESDKVFFNEVIGFTKNDEKRLDPAQISTSRKTGTVPDKMKEKINKTNPDEFKSNLTRLIDVGKDDLWLDLLKRLQNFRFFCETKRIILDDDLLVKLPTDREMLTHAKIVELLYNLLKTAINYKGTPFDINKDRGHFLYTLIGGDYSDEKDGKIKSVALKERYCGVYRIYYYSAHYEDEIHSGLLRIFHDDNGGYVARMVFGINNIKKLENPSLFDIINANSQTDAFERFCIYRDSFRHRYNQRFYLFEGVVDSNNYFLNIYFHGTGKTKDHRMTLYLNIARAASYDRILRYSGGLGMAVSSPNSSTAKVRSFKLGLATRDIKIDFSDSKLKDLLKLSVTKYQRSQVQKDDDSEWWSYILECKAKSESTDSTIDYEI